RPAPVPAGGLPLRRAVRGHALVQAGWPAAARLREAARDGAGGLLSRRNQPAVVQGAEDVVHAPVAERERLLLAVADDAARVDDEDRPPGAAEEPAHAVERGHLARRIGEQREAERIALRHPLVQLQIIGGDRPERGAGRDEALPLFLVVLQLAHADGREISWVER